MIKKGKEVRVFKKMRLTLFEKNMENKHTLSDLQQMQSLPLSAKMQMTRRRINAWVEEFGEDGVYISFSGGKDSTVLLDIARKDYPNIEAVFINTGLEYPSVKNFALNKENVKELRPQMNFRDVIIKYGYPLISKEVAQTIYEVKNKMINGVPPPSYRMKKLEGNAIDKEGNKSRYNIPQWKFLLASPFMISHKCCDVMKKNPAKIYEKSTNKKVILGTMADESELRKTKWIQNGCNAFEVKRPNSSPMSFWTENDVLTYIHENNLTIAEAYGNIIIENKTGIEGQINIQDILNDYRECKYRTTGCKRTGCIFCLFGITQDKDRILKLRCKEPKLANYVLCGGEFNEKRMWQPNKEGLGYKFIIDWLNEHGNLEIKY